VWTVAQLFCAGRFGINSKTVCQTTFVHHVLKNELGHRGTTNIAVADEKYFNHDLHILSFPSNPFLYWHCKDFREEAAFSFFDRNSYKLSNIFHEKE